MTASESMDPSQIDRFFETLAEQLHEPVRVILTGAAAGSLLGHVRPSLDVDFAIVATRRGPQAWTRIEAAVERTIRLTQTQANYAEDIDRWSSVTLLDYRRHTTPYRRFGTVEVRLLDPAYWSIGKIGRYLPPDCRDLEAVLKQQQVPAGRLIRLWAKALRASPRSPALAQFRDHAEDFLRTSGPAIWGARFDSSQPIKQFRAALASRATVRRPASPA